MNTELLRRGELNIEDAAFVRDYFIPAAMKSERWNIVVFEAFRTIELLIKGIVCLSGREPLAPGGKPIHEVHHLIDHFLKMLAAEKNLRSFLYSAAGANIARIVGESKGGVGIRSVQIFSCAVVKPGDMPVTITSQEIEQKKGNAAMARKKKPAQRHQISVERKGKTYQANYYVESGVVTVEAMSKHGTIERNQTQIGGSTGEHMARMLLRELIDAGRVPESR